VNDIPAGTGGTDAGRATAGLHVALGIDIPAILLARADEVIE
jgi:hypothetical protein